MQTVHAVRTLADLSSEISRDIDSVADRVFELHRQALVLQERSKATYSEKAVQADHGFASAQYELDRARRLAPFEFKPRAGKLNWKKIRALNIDRTVREADGRALMDVFHEVAHADLEADSAYNLTEANLMKLVQVCQLLLQYMQYNVEQGYHANQLLQEEKAAVLAQLQAIPSLTVAEVGQGLRTLEQDFYKVADADLDAMFQQVRTEERTDARDVVGHTMDQAKHALAARAELLSSQLPQATAGAAAAGASKQKPDVDAAAAAVSATRISSAQLGGGKGAPGGGSLLGVGASGQAQLPRPAPGTYPWRSQQGAAAAAPTSASASQTTAPAPPAAATSLAQRLNAAAGPHPQQQQQQGYSQSAFSFPDQASLGGQSVPLARAPSLGRQQPAQQQPIQPQQQNQQQQQGQPSGAASLASSVATVATAHGVGVLPRQPSLGQQRYSSAPPGPAQTQAAADSGDPFAAAAAFGHGGLWVA